MNLEQLFKIFPEAFKEVRYETEKEPTGPIFSVQPANLLHRAVIEILPSDEGKKLQIETEIVTTQRVN